ncbi:MAG: rod shape-determining protein MreC [Lentisphaeria bacterium]|nr:rod shape-determining protein MreC [Lentisphaeria bacterium]
MPGNNITDNRLMITILCVIAFIFAAVLTYRWWGGMLSRTAGGFFRPYLELANVSNSVLSDRTLLLHDRITLAREIETLRRHNTNLESRSGLAMALLEENRRLRRHLNLRPPRDWHYVHTEVLLRDPYAWHSSFTIGHGEVHGISTGDAVIEIRTPGIRNLVGIIGKTEPYRAQVLPLGNPGVRISVRLGKGETVGFLNVSDRTASLQEIPVGLLPKDYVLQKGQVVTTTGLERSIPDGLKVGEMSSIDSEGEFFAGDSQKSGFVKLTADYNSLRFLVVITGKKGK